MRPDFWVVQTFNGLSYGALLFLLASGLSRPRSGAQRTGCSAHDPARGPGSYTQWDTLRPVAAYLDSGRSVPTTTNGGYEDEKRFAVMRRVELFSDEALALQKAVPTDLETYVVAQGVSKEWVESYAAEQLKRLRGA